MIHFAANFHTVPIKLFANISNIPVVTVSQILNT